MRRRLVALLAVLMFSQLGVIYIQTTAAPGYPISRGVGAFGKSTGTVRPGLPSGWAEGDLLVAFLETSDEAITAPVTSPVWVEAASSPTARTGFSRVTIFYRLAMASEGNPDRTFSDSGNHGCGVILAVETGTFNSSTPVAADNSNDQSSTTSISITGATATTANSLVVASTGGSRDCNGCPIISGWTNSNLSDIIEEFDSSCMNGNGGTLAIMSGNMATADPVGTTTATSSYQQSFENYMMIINPAP